MTTEESDDAQTGSTPDEENDRKRRSMKDEGEDQNNINQENEKSRLSNTTKTQSAKFVHTQAQVDAEMTTEESDDAQTGSTPPDEKNDRKRRSMKDEGEGQNTINQENEKSRLSNTTKTQSAKFVHTQAQVDAIANIMRFNIDKVMERDKTLNELVSRADNLDEAAGAFKNTAGKLKNTFFWKDFKMTLILIVVGVVVVLIVIVFLVFHFKH